MYVNLYSTILVFRQMFTRILYFTAVDKVLGNLHATVALPDDIKQITGKPRIDRKTSKGRNTIFSLKK